jgi:hypothetical protein
VTSANQHPVSNALAALEKKKSSGKPEALQTLRAIQRVSMFV